MTTNKNIIQRFLLFIINLYVILEYWTLTTEAISGITTGRIADAWGDSIFMLLISVTCLIITLTVNRQINNKFFVLLLINSVLYFLMIFPANKIKLPITTLFSILSIGVLIRQTIEMFRNNNKE